jgi:hypothetical protein
MGKSIQKIGGLQSKRMRVPEWRELVMNRTFAAFFQVLLDTGTITNRVNFANNRNGRFAYVGRWNE